MSKPNLSILAGGFHGDEGKEAVFSYLSVQDRIGALVRSQGPQHGGEVWYKGPRSIHDYVPEDEYVYDPKKGEKHKFRQIPAPYNTKADLFLAAGSFVSEKVLPREINTYQEWDVGKRIRIDGQATAVLDRHEIADESLKDEIGSVGTGYRAAARDRILGKTDVLVRNVPGLKQYSEGVCVWREINDRLNEDKSVMILGVQSTHLSNLYGDFPHTNIYDNIASAILGQVGIGPNRDAKIYLVFKAFVSKVGKGTLEGKITEEEAVKRGWEEYGTVTNRLRDVAPFNYKLAKDSIVLNTPTDLALTKADVLYPGAAGVTDWSDLPEDCQLWVEDMEKRLQIPKYETPPITLIKTGPGTNDIIDMRAEKGTI